MVAFAQQSNINNSMNIIKDLKKLEKEHSNKVRLQVVNKLKDEITREEDKKKVLKAEAEKIHEQRKKLRELNTRLTAQMDRNKEGMQKIADRLKELRAECRQRSRRSDVLGVDNIITTNKSDK